MPWERKQGGERTFRPAMSTMNGKKSMKLRFGLVLGTAACVLLAGCEKGGKEPKGQVVATVNGDEITAIDLRNEMGNFRAPDAKIRKAAEQAALDRIIQRKLLFAAAEERKLDKTPEYAQQKERMEELALIQFWQSRIASAVPPPNKDEIDAFVAANPDLYSARKILLIDQVRTPLVQDPALIEQLKPLKTLEEVTALLNSKNVRFQQGGAQLDALTTPPPLFKQIIKLPPAEVFVIPQGNVLTINRIRETRVVPVPAEVATAHATQLLRTERTQTAVERELGAAVSAGRAKKDAIKYAKAFQPTTPVAKAAPVAKQ